MDFEKLNFISKQFFINGKVLNIDQINTGNVNKTYIVKHQYKYKTSKFILQCLSNIFESQESVNMNHKIITDHINDKQNSNYFSDFIHNSRRNRWEVPNLIRCKSNNRFVFPFESDLWRAMVYIDKTFCADFLKNETMAYETGIGLSKFHLICSDLDRSKLKISINNFHNTNHYIDQYIIAITKFNNNDLHSIEKERINELINNLSKHIDYVRILYTYLRKNIIDYNVIHGDPKLSNFLFDLEYKYVVSLIDLDTVSSGCVLTDMADCIRSICNLVGEDPRNKDYVSFDIISFMNFLKGYFSVTKVINNYSFRFLLEFIYLIIFELTIRFFTDFLQSNRYFKVKYKTHNLFRAEVQYRLLSSFLNQIPNLSAELKEIGIYSSSTFFSDVQKIV